MTAISVYRVKSVTVEPVSRDRLNGYTCYLEIETEQGGMSLTLYAFSRAALDFIVDAPADSSGVWPASKLPTCPKCGWPPMVDAENATEDDPAPVVCAC